MKHFLAGLTAITLAPLFLAACGESVDSVSPAISDSSAEVSSVTSKAAETVITANLDEVGDGSAICPSSEVISDISFYRNDHPKPYKTDYREPHDYPAWHAENGKRANVVTKESGLQYQIVKKGASNGPSPSGSQVIKVNYHGFFINNEVFDSSYERGEPIEFPANGVIQGWIEGLGYMKPCDAWTFYIPGNLAYGPRGRGGIPPNASLGFHVQLIEVK